VPVSTYRLQLGPGLTFDDATDRLPYLVSLGVTHVYLSPILTAAPGSTHGYDVVDHDEIAPVLGGRAGFDRLSDAARAHGLGLVLDIVPNHMAVPTPAWHNRAWWSVLAEGPASPYARWFDLDWPAGDGALLMPVLDGRLGAAIDAGELEVVRSEPGLTASGLTEPSSTEPGLTGLGPLLRYREHVFPVRPGTEALPLPELLRRQHYRLAPRQAADDELNYRRFFDVSTLVGLRVEDSEVFAATHDLVVSLVRSGQVDGLRVDHPDGLADPAAYLERLREATGGAWVVAEKILSGDESLPDDWACAGTTGYDALWRVQQTFVDPAGQRDLGAVLHLLAGDAPDAFGTLVADAKREVMDTNLRTEVRRLTTLAAKISHEEPRLRDHSTDALRDCLVELIVALDRYRAYVTPDRPAPAESVAVLETAADQARAHLDHDRAETMTALVDLLLGRQSGDTPELSDLVSELMVRFGQTCGPVQAKGVEDTAFYRWTELIGLCEVGGDPVRFFLPPEGLLTWADQMAATFPAGMTASSTHDTKRGEDVRARLSVISEHATAWRRLVDDLHRASQGYREASVDGRTENVLWQTLAGTWTDDGPISVDRLVQYLTKAMREAKSVTSWSRPDSGYEAAVLETARQAVADPTVVALLEHWQERTRTCVRATTLGQKLLQLTLPGVADTYQGTETTGVTLVDPDNRRPVGWVSSAATLDRLDSGEPARTLAEEKLLLTSRALRARRALPDVFVGPEGGVLSLARSSDSALAYARTVAGDPRVVVLATRLTASLERLGGWRDHTVVLPEGPWHDVLTDTDHPGGTRLVADLLDTLPVALLVRPAGS